MGRVEVSRGWNNIFIEMLRDLCHTMLEIIFLFVAKHKN
jgi:hypothetical protein